MADNQKPDPKAKADDTTNSKIVIKTVDIGSPPKEDQPDSKNTDSSDDKTEKKKSDKSTGDKTKTEESTGAEPKRPKDMSELMLGEIHSGSPWALEENANRF